METRRHLRRILLVLALTFSVAPPPETWSFSTPLGTARAGKAARISLDDGKTWLTFNERALPVLQAAQLRTAGDTALVDLTDGAQVEVLPFSAVRFHEVNGAPEVSVTYGRLTFRVPSEGRLEILTPSARLAGTGQASVGELFVSDRGLMGVKMSEGSFAVRPQGVGMPTRVAGGEPMFLPARPTSGVFFTTDPTPPAPAGARGVFTPAGESLGYLDADGRLVVSPGFTRDLTRPFSPKLVRPAGASIPEERRARGDATPLFDVQGRYVGYLAGPDFHPQGSPALATAGVTPAMAATGTGAPADADVGIAAPPPGRPRCPGGPPGKPASRITPRRPCAPPPPPR